MEVCGKMAEAISFEREKKERIAKKAAISKKSRMPAGSTRNPSGPHSSTGIRVHPPP